jgi:hypothetical protein
VHTTWLIAFFAALSFHLLGSARPLPPEQVLEPPPPAPSPAAPGAGPDVPAEQTQSLLRLEPFVGGRWISEGVLTGGHRYTAVRRYEWFMDRRFLRIHQRLTVDSVTVDEEGVIGWDANANELRFWSFASDGSFAEGRERPATGDNRWVFEGRTIGGRGGEWRLTTLLVDPSSFSMLLEVRNGGTFAPALTLAYRRVAEARDTIATPDTAAIRIDTTAVRRDTTAVGSDTMAVRRDTTVVRSDTMAVRRDTTAVRNDTTAVRRDTVAIRIARGELRGEDENVLVAPEVRLYIPRHGRTHRTHGPEAADPPDAALARRRLSV